jgi:hypothetical protein
MVNRIQVCEHKCCGCGMQIPHSTVFRVLCTQVVMLHLPDPKFVATDSLGNMEGSFIREYYML